jgi:serralysin
MRHRHPTWLVLAALLLAGCGKIDDLSSQDAASWCDFPIGGEAARVEVRRQRDNDGRVDLTVSKYDAYDGLTLRATDSRDDERFEQLGTPFEDIQTAYFSYDEVGNWTRRDYDVGGEGDVDESAYRTFDEAGQLIEEGLDQNGDGIWEWVNRTEYDDDGHWMWGGTDEDGDGACDVLFTASYDEHGRMLAQTLDDDGDGEIDSATEYTYDDNGGSVAVLDEGADGDADSTTRTSVSPDGAVTTVDVDSGLDGDIDSTTRTTLDDEGRQIEDARDEDGDGVFEYVETASYTAGGELAEETLDINGDGEPEMVWTSTYDDDGRPLTKETSYSGGLTGLAGESEAPLTTVIAYVYDGETATRTSQSFSDVGLEKSCRERTVAGHPVELRCDDDGDGRDDSVTTYATCD